MMEIRPVTLADAAKIADLLTQLGQVEATCAYSSRSSKQPC